MSSHEVVPMTWREGADFRERLGTLTPEQANEVLNGLRRILIVASDREAFR